MYKVIIVEDDPMVAELDKQFIERNTKLNIDGIFHNGKDALDFLNKNSVDLIILDYYMPIMSGLELLTALRNKNNNTDVIMVTAANDSNNVANLCSMGVIDYLIKPFNFSRFQTALSKFITKHDLLDSNSSFTQEDLDQIISNPKIKNEDTYIDKGIQQKTLDLIYNYLDEHINEHLTVENINETIPLSKVTIRRYMNFLIEKNEVIGSIDYNTGGRPSSIYIYLGKK